MNLQVITKEGFLQRRWRGPDGFRHAANDWLVPLGISELSSIVPSYPIALVTRGEVTLPHALLGFRPGQNLLVGPDGRWRAGPVPGFLRHYPFRLASLDSGDWALAVDMDSGLVDETGPEPFFEAGELAARIQEIQRLVVQQEQAQIHAARACAVLAEHGVIVPWPLTLRGPDGDRQLEGLSKIDEEALGRVPGAALEAMRNCGGLGLAYCQLLSTQQLTPLAKWMGQQEPAERQVVPVTDWPAFDGTISFANLT